MKSATGVARRGDGGARHALDLAMFEGLIEAAEQLAANAAVDPA
jgi:hypothetical protein